MYIYVEVRAHVQQKYKVQGSNFKLSPSLGHPGYECCHNSDFFKIPSQGYRQYMFILSNFSIIE